MTGELDTAALRAMTPAEVRTSLERLPGIGPFSSAIIVVRALGYTDYLAGPITELNGLVGEFYQLGHPAAPEELDDIARTWSPWRTGASSTSGLSAPDSPPVPEPDQPASVGRIMHDLRRALV